MTCENFLNPLSSASIAIAAGIQVDHLIAAGLGCLLVRFEIGRQIRDGDRRAGHDAAARVLDHSGQRRAIDLREGDWNVQQKHGNHQHQAVRHPFHELSSRNVIDHGALFSARGRRNHRQPRVGRRPVPPESGVRRVVARRHRAATAREHVQVIRIVSMRCNKRVIAVAHRHDVAVRDPHRLVAPLVYRR